MTHGWLALAPSAITVNHLILFKISEITESGFIPFQTRSPF